MNGDLSKKEFGDYQTPPRFCGDICRFLEERLIEKPSVIFEPTCGIGNFLISAGEVFSTGKRIGVEINEEYIKQLKSTAGPKVTLYHEDFFRFDLIRIKELCRADDPILIIGNPPWVNNAALSTISGKNQPVKSNFKKMRGIDAITGSSNFDLCEYIILKLVNEFQNRNAVIAMLCKTSVARNVFLEINRSGRAIRLAQILLFDAKKIFDVSTEACLFILATSNRSESTTFCSVAEFYRPDEEKYRLEAKNGQLFSSLREDKADLDGKCCFEWRQGIKHDCSKIMELSFRGGEYYNGNGDPVDIEEDLIFPLVKSSHIKSPILTNFRKYVIVTQRKVGEPTDSLRLKYPKTWKYLSRNIDCFEKRKSVIYRKAPMFGIFGVGDYSFAPYKVGVSGFYKEPLFSLFNAEKPVMLDDTCYFLSFDDLREAYVALLILNSETAREFLKDISFAGSKRPYTKKLLSRFDFFKCLNCITFNDLIATEASLSLKRYLSKSMWDHFVEMVQHSEQDLFVNIG